MVVKQVAIKWAAKHRPRKVVSSISEFGKIFSLHLRCGTRRVRVIVDYLHVYYQDELHICPKCGDVYHEDYDDD